MSERLDGGYAWAIVVACFIITCCVLGTGKTSGVLFVHFRSEYNASYTATATVSLSQKVSETGTALIWSFLAEHFGSRPVMLVGAVFLVIGTVASSFVRSIYEICITYGIITGLGMSMLIAPAAQMLPKYFDKKLPMAAALGFTGGSFGPLILPLIITFGIEEYGLSGSFFVLAGVYLQAFIAAVLMRPPEHLNQKPQNENENNASKLKNNKTFQSTLDIYLSCLRNKSLLLFYFAQSTTVLSAYCFLTYQQAHVNDRGITDPEMQAWLTSIWGMTEILARTIFGFVLQSAPLPPYRIYQMSLFVMAAIFSIYPLFNSYWTIAVASAAVAFFFSSAVVSVMPTLRYVVGIDQCSVSIGLLCLPILIGYVCVQIGGVIRDATGSFTFIYYAASACLLAGCVAVELLAFRLKQSICHNLPCCKIDQANFLSNPLPRSQSEEEEKELNIKL